MERTAEIGGKEYRLVINGGTPRIYRSLFKRDIFRDMPKAVSANGEINDTEVFEDLAFVAAVQGGSISLGTKIEDWLASLDSPLAVLEIVPTLMEMWAADTATISTAKKE